MLCEGSWENSAPGGVGAEEHPPGEGIKKVTFLELVHDRPLDLCKVQLDVGFLEAGIDGIQAFQR